eukprot:8264102-Pyramimonas_sp.AAC.1
MPRSMEAATMPRAAQPLTTSSGPIAAGPRPALPRARKPTLAQGSKGLITRHGACLVMRAAVVDAPRCSKWAGGAVQGEAAAAMASLG